MPPRSTPMAAFNSALPALALALACLAGCETTHEIRERWTYSGRDESRRAPQRVPRGELSASAWMAERMAREAEWRQAREQIIERAKDDCARETGDSKVPGYWFGFSRAFTDCMHARGWTVGGIRYDRGWGWREINVTDR